MRKPDFRICKNKGADQLRGNHAADQRLCFRYIDSTTPLLLKPLAIFCGCAARFVLDLVGNPKSRFSHDKAQLSNILTSVIVVLFTFEKTLFLRSHPDAFIQ